ncbi:MAG: hypothetical protein GXO64_00115 [Candidatus Micrarchaeota archaeon]|nr:hypothetical protein [Candidatus Micrarchaeota archaeon]
MARLMILVLIVSVLILSTAMSGCVSNAPAAPPAPASHAAPVQEKQGMQNNHTGGLNDTENLQVSDSYAEQKKPAEKDEQKKAIDLSNLPKFVNHNFIELDKISMISKYRSGYGHDFSHGTGETCRSMKHYLWLKGIDESVWSRIDEGTFGADDWPSVKYFSPADGTIIDMRTATNVFGQKEAQFIIRSDEYPQIYFNFFHVRPKDGLSKGSHVKAGEYLGTVSGGSDAEIAASVFMDGDEHLVSFFELIDDSVFAEYEKRGVKSVDDLIISKEERDKNPLKCAEEMPHRFIGNSFTSDKGEYDTWSMGPDNWVVLDE